MMEFNHKSGSTPLDADESDGLLLTHITTRAELDRWEQDNIVEALEWAERAKSPDILTDRFIKELHRRMFRNVWKWAGHYRKSDKNIGCPWHNIALELRALLDDTHFWVTQQLESHDMIAVRFHHRLVSIHPFPNGNGWHARLMADLLLDNIFHSPRFTWGSKDLSEQGALRTRYIDALHAADDGDYELLLKFART